MKNAETDWKELKGLLTCQPNEIKKNIENCETYLYAKQIAPYIKELNAIFGNHNYDIIERKKKWDFSKA